MVRSLVRSLDFDLDIYPSKAVLEKSVTLLLAGGYLLAVGIPGARQCSPLGRRFQLADGRLEISPLPLGPGGEPVPALAVVIGTGLDPAAWRKALRELERAAPGQRRKMSL